MAYHKHPLGVLIEVRPSEVRERILEAYTQAKASLTDAALVLECSLSSLLRWIEKLDMMAELRGIKKKAKREGWHHDRNSLGGRPVSTPTPKKRKKAA